MGILHIPTAHPHRHCLPLTLPPTIITATRLCHCHPPSLLPPALIVTTHPHHHTHPCHHCPCCCRHLPSSSHPPSSLLPTLIVATCALHPCSFLLPAHTHHCCQCITSTLIEAHTHCCSHHGLVEIGRASCRER